MVCHYPTESLIVAGEDVDDTFVDRTGCSCNNCHLLIEQHGDTTFCEDSDDTFADWVECPPTNCHLLRTQHGDTTFCEERDDTFADWVECSSNTCHLSVAQHRDTTFWDSSQLDESCTPVKFGLADGPLGRLYFDSATKFDAASRFCSTPLPHVDCVFRPAFVCALTPSPGLWDVFAAIEQRSAQPLTEHAHVNNKTVRRPTDENYMMICLAEIPGFLDTIDSFDRSAFNSFL